MSSLKADFAELMHRIWQGRELSHASFEPIFYLVFHPSRIIEVKRQLPAWTAKLQNEGWTVEQFSIAEEIAAIHAEAPLRQVWLQAEQKDPLNWQKANSALENALVKTGRLKARLGQALERLQAQDRAILFVTDLEALHPYLRIGAIEGDLQGKFQVPTVFLYPGVRTGKSRLKFLGFYPEDGNYRSVHVGG
jgi:hypothetical protein